MRGGIGLIKYVPWSALVAISLAAAACADSGSPDDETVGSSLPTVTTVETTAAVQQTSPPTTRPGIPGTLSDPYPVGDPDLSVFSYREQIPLGETVDWEGFAIGLVKRSKATGNSEPGDCYLFLATLTPTVTGGGDVASLATLPGLALMAGNDFLGRTMGRCDVTAVEDAGYQPILGALLSSGDTHQVYAEFFVSGDEPAPPDAVVVSGRDATFVYEATVLESIPTPETTA